LSRHLLEAFVEDEIALVPDKLSFTGAVRWGLNNVTGFTVQPTARLMWTPASRLASWAAVSQAVRTPDLTMSEMNAFLGSVPVQPGLAGLIELQSDAHAGNEPMLAYEIGQRVQASKRLSVDLTAFYNDYRKVGCQLNLAPYLVGPSGADPAYLDIPIQFSDGCRAESFGAEASVTWNAASRWRLIGGYDWLRVHIHPESGATTNFAQYEGSSPHHQSLARSELDLSRRLEFDTALYFDGAMPENAIPRQYRVDARLGWKISHSLELSAGVQDGMRPYHTEFYSTRVMESLLVHRNFYGRLTWRF
jgi:iron complex outermembrane recepter protein